MAQTDTLVAHPQPELPFIAHLIHQNLLAEAQYELHRFQPLLTQHSPATDSLRFLAGALAFKKHEFSNAYHCFKASEIQTDPNREFLLCHCALRLRLFNLDTIASASLIGAYHFGFFKTASTLLQHQKGTLDSLRSMPKRTIYMQTNLLEISEQLKTHKPLSPIKGAVLSAIVPGLGKWYGGYRTEAVSLFSICTLMAIQAMEGYSKTKFNSPHFYVFGSLFTIFYGGGIWGSYYRIKNRERHFYENMDRQVYDLLDVHARQIEQL